MFCFIGLISSVSFSQNANTLPPAGNVGVGTTTPSVPLDVVGGTKLGGTVVIDSTVIIKDSLTINKRLTIKQDIKVVGKSVFVDDVKAKANLRVLGVARMKDRLVVDSVARMKNKLVVDGLTRMNGDAKVFGNLKIKSLENPTLTYNRLVSINPNGKIQISNLKLAVDDMFVCSTSIIAPWVGLDGTNTDDDILLCPNYKSVTIGGNLNVQGKSILKTAGIGNVLASEIGASLPTFYIKREGLPNSITAKFEASDATSNRVIFFSNTLSNGGHNILSKVGDVGIFWTNNFNGINGSGFVLAPKLPTGIVPNIPIGMRIDENGRFGFNTAINNQAQYTMRSNSTIGLLINNTSTPATFYGLRTVTPSNDIAISVAGPTTSINDHGFFSVSGIGQVVIKANPSATTKQFVIQDINNPPNPNNPTNDVFRIMSNGNVVATRVRVLEVADFPDYVFNTNYKLMPLTQLENYVFTNKHLPQLPTAADVEKEGLDLGEMNKLLVEKIEELTLYMIQMNKEITELKAANKQFKK